MNLSIAHLKNNAQHCNMLQHLVFKVSYCDWTVIIRVGHEQDLRSPFCACVQNILTCDVCHCKVEIHVFQFILDAFPP